MTLDNAALPQVSVVVPVFNEQDNIAPLVHEITAALRGLLPFEIIYVDDCSKDASREILKQLRETVPELRVFGHTRQSGQSTAIRNGVKQARGEWIATLDGDGQNDPADIPKLLSARDAADPAVKLFAGWRVERKDTGSKRWASKAANAIRSRLLRDETPDTGCGIKLFERAPLPPGSGQARRLAVGQRAGQSSRTQHRRVQIQQPGPRLGRHRRSARRELADQTQQNHRNHRTMMNLPIEWLAWTGLVITPWKLIGYTGALMFGGRWLVQFIASKRAGKPVIPRVFWYMSVVGSLMTLSYFLFSSKQDSVGVLQNLFPTFTALYSLYLDIKHRGWHRDKAAH
jgi:lipid-A-disaccharide synthase-like uncharacterized protein